MVRATQLARRRSAGQIDDDAGFTMVELVVSIMIFALTIAAIAAGMSTSFNLTRGNRNRSVAANLAAQEMDTIRSTSFTNLAIGQLTTTQTVSGVAYTVTRQTQWVTQSGSSGSCGVASGQQLRYLSIVVSVSWANMSGVTPISSSTLMSPPAGTGSIDTFVKDRVGGGVPSATVTLTDPNGNTSTKTTGSNGCAFFSSLEPGTYSVAVAKTGYVDWQGAAGPSKSIAVYSGGIYGVQLDYDNAATLSLTLAGTSGAAFPSSVPVTLSNTSLLPAGTKVFTGTTNPRLIGNLFPFSSGYTAWAGSCSDAMPPSSTAINVPPGLTSPGSITLPRITIKTQTLAGVARSGATITSVHAADLGCASGESYTLGTTDATGTLVVALPYGLWSLIATLTGTPHTSCTGGTATSPCKGTLSSTMQTVTFKW